MAHLRCDFRSDAMGMNTSMTVILPEKTDLSQVPVVYLLHGLEDNCTGWARYTSVERYAREKNAALVMPEVQRSFYADMDKVFPISPLFTTNCWRFAGAFSGSPPSGRRTISWVFPWVATAR